MALSLALSYLQFNDSKVIKFTDITGIGTNGWGDGTNINVTDIDGSAHTLELGITITLSDGTETTYDYINLYTEFGPFTTTDDLVFDIDSSMLISSGIDLGTSEDKFPDGIYSVTYYVDRGQASATYINYRILIDGIVRAEVYNELREIPVAYTAKENFRDTFPNKDILDALSHYSYLKGLEASSAIAKEEELLSILSTLQNIYNL